ncbi:ABC transporter permease [Pseudonocardia acaciae]|uniref:ABC transporter permease n=1 Tax=Pseudonocardia acaciae TaxID=551276 RepID=UPI000AC62ADF|nr:ABC transporter permease [Pseudonocardia acaciae]
MIRRLGLVVSGLVVSLAVLCALAPAALTPYSPIDGVPTDKFQSPGPRHPFGTDALGRDLLARVIHGTGTSLGAVLVAVLVAFLAGTALGLLAGFAGGPVDEVLMRVVDVLLSIPSLLVSLIVITALGFGMANVAIAVGVGSVAAFARVMRSQVIKVRTATFVEAARACGVRRPALLCRHVLPNSVGPVTVLATLELGVAVLSISALSFLGFGATPPSPEWGALVADGRRFIATAWWLSTLPGAVIVAVVLAANHLGHALDTRTR